MKARYIKGSTLAWPNIWNDLHMEKDKGGRWYPSESTPAFVAEYCRQYRSPSRSWPMSYAKPLLTAKFAKKLCEALPELAIKCGIAEKA